MVDFPKQKRYCGTTGTKMKHRLPIILLITLAITAGAQASKYPLTVTDCRGKQVTLKTEPKRIISTTPSNTEILFALGLGDRIVGVTNWCDYPAEAREKPRVGDRVISIEKVLSLKPDLVVAHGFLNVQAIKDMESHGIKVIAVDPKNIDAVAKDILLIGRATNREIQARKIATKITDAKAVVKRATLKNRNKPKVLVSVQGSPLWASGPDTYVNEMVSLSGGANIMAKEKPGFNQYSTEIAVYRNPDIIIATNKSDLPIFKRGIWAHTAASEKDRVYYVNPDIIVRPGPRLAEGIKQIARLISPDAFD